MTAESCKMSAKRPSRDSFVTILCGLAALWLVGVAGAAPLGSAVTYQGQLRTGAGLANGVYDMRFRLYTAGAGGSQIGTQLSFNDVPVEDGVFTVDLNFGASAFGSEARWVEIDVRPGAGGTYAVLSPRQPIMPAPVALYALNAAGGGSGFWSANGSSIYKTNSGNVGIGTDAPQAPLEVASRVRIAHDGGSGPFIAPGTGTLDLTSNAIGNELPYGAIRFLNTSNVERARIEYGVPDTLFAPTSMRLETAGVTRMAIADNGYVGVGLLDPQFLLDVNDRGRIRQGARGSAGLYFFQNTPNEDRGFVGMRNDDLLGFYGTEGAGWGLVMNNATGAVGIGTEAPTARLDVEHRGSVALRGGNLNTSGTAYGVFGYSNSNVGVGTYGQGNYGVYGFSGTGRGVYGRSQAPSGRGVLGTATGDGSSAGVQGENEGTGWAGLFFGPTIVEGNFFVVSGSKNFLIDHPLNPSEEYLVHSCVESDEMKNVYDGVALLDDNGEAEVALPDWFDQVNADFRYQLTCVGGYAPVYVAARIKNNRFTIAGGKPGLEVSWQVTGVRIDPSALAVKFRSEIPKPESDRGTYLFPEGYGQPASARPERLSNPLPNLHSRD